MDALVRKEVRAILPAWGCALALAILPIWLVWPGPHGMLPDTPGLAVFAPFALGVLLLCLTPFGQELNWGTFSVLLSQPISRRRIWMLKTLLLGLGLLAVLAAFFVSSHARVDSVLEATKHTTWRTAFSRPDVNTQIFLNAIAGAREQTLHDTLLVGGLIVLSGFAGGLWTTLLFRQVTAAFWLTFLVPIGLGLLAGKVLQYLPDALAPVGMTLVMGAYAVAGFLYARRLFAGVQDTQWTGGIVSLPSFRTATGDAGSGVRSLRPIRALLAKEIQAQHVNLLLAGGLALLHLAVILVRRIGFDYLANHRSVAMSLEAFPVLWLALPLLVGSVTVAEERKLGMLDALLCSPASRRLQFTAKVIVALVLGIVLGGLLPLLLEQLARPVSSLGPTSLYFFGEFQSVNFLQIYGAAGLTFVSVYGSTLTRNTLQGMGAGLMAAVLFCLVAVGARLAGEEQVLLWRGRLFGCLALPLMTLTVLILAYRNFGLLQPGLKAWGRNGLTLFLALLCVSGLTTTIYHRAWEAWQSEEPSHGWVNGILPMIRNQNGLWTWGERAPSPKMQAGPFSKAVALPDGRLWLQQQSVRVLSRSAAPSGMVMSYASGPSYTGFVEGNDWKDVAVNDLGAVAIRRDGTLWDLTGIQPKAAQPGRIGNGGEWDKICAAGEHFVALKADGTLWEGGLKVGDQSPTEYEPKLSGPIPVGNDNDWVAICDSRPSTVAVKADGSVWIWNWTRTKRSQPKQWLTGACGRPVSLALNNRALAAVCADGTLWLGGDLTNSVYARFVGPHRKGPLEQEMVRWGPDSDWREISFVGWGRAVGVKRDGSLWEWDITTGVGSVGGWVVPPGRPSRYLDWVGVCGYDNAFLALARDGSLCLWGDPEELRYSDWNGPDPNRWLMPSRIKARRIADLANR